MKYPLNKAQTSFAYIGMIVITVITVVGIVVFTQQSGTEINLSADCAVDQVLCKIRTCSATGDCPTNICGQNSKCENGNCVPGACEFAGGAALTEKLQVEISGKINYYLPYPETTPDQTKPVPDVLVRLEGPNPQETTTNCLGEYSFTVDAGESWSVIPEKTEKEGRIEAISALDSARILRNVVEKERFNKFQDLAADTTGNGAVSALDAAKIQAYVVEKIARLPAAEKCASDWLFVPVSGQEPILSGTCTMGSISYESLNSPALNQDFTAVLLGDVTVNWNTPVCEGCKSDADCSVGETCWQGECGTSHCGDGICNKAYEDCPVCPKDCGSVENNYCCGDSFCCSLTIPYPDNCGIFIEDSSTCSQDCQELR